MLSTEEEQQQQQSSNIGDDGNSNVPPNSESTDQQQRDVAAEMASSLARSAEISEDGELPHPTTNNDNDKLNTSQSISSSTSTVLSPLQRKLIADQNSRVGNSLEGGRSIENRSVDQSITSSVYGNSVDSHHSWNPVSSVASSTLGRSQALSLETITQDVNHQSSR